MEYYCLELPKHHFTALKNFKIVYSALVGNDLLSTLLFHKYNVASLLLIPWQMFKQVLFFSVSSWLLLPKPTLLHLQGWITLVSLCVSLVTRMFNSENFFPRIVNLWKRLPHGCFLEHYYLNHLKSRVNYLSLIIFNSYFLLFHSYHALHSVSIYLEWLLGFVLDEYY